MFVSEGVNGRPGGETLEGCQMMWRWPGPYGIWRAVYHVACEVSSF